MCPIKITRKVKLISALFSIGLTISLIFYVGFFVGTMSQTASTDALKSLVDVNTALIGFLAVIAVFVLTTINNSIQAVDGEIRQAQAEHERNMETISTMPMPRPSGESYSDLVEKENKKFEKKKQALESRKKTLRDKAKSSIRWLLGAVIAFVISILLTLLAIGQYGTQGGVYGPFVYFGIYSCIIGIFAIFFQIALLQEE